VQATEGGTAAEGSSVGTCQTAVVVDHVGQHGLCGGQACMNGVGLSGSKVVMARITSPFQCLPFSGPPPRMMGGFARECVVDEDGPMVNPCPPSPVASLHHGACDTARMAAAAAAAVDGIAMQSVFGNGDSPCADLVEPLSPTLIASMPSAFLSVPPSVQQPQSATVNTRATVSLIVLTSLGR
jgi:hypothetical protein